jgi:plasmid stability protein
MTARQPRYSKEEFARRGEAIYESEIRSQVEADNDQKIVAIDIETGAFEVADEPRIAVERLYDRYPDAQPWMRRIGKDSAVHRMLGFRVKRHTAQVEAESSEILKQYASKADSERFREILARVPNVAPMPGDEIDSGKTIKSDCPELPTSIEANSIDLATQGINPEQAEILQTNLATFAADWNSPEMGIYDDYDTAKADRLPS